MPKATAVVGEVGDAPRPIAMVAAVGTRIFQAEPRGVAISDLGGGTRRVVPTLAPAALTGLRDEVWAVAVDTGGGELARLDGQGQLRERVGLPALGSSPTISACRVGQPSVIVQGGRAALWVGLRQGALKTHALGVTSGPGGDDVLVPIPGVEPAWVARKEGRLVLATERTALALELPIDLTRARITSGAALLDRDRLGLELAGAGVHHIAVINLRRRDLSLRLRLQGDRHVAWVEDRAELLVTREDGELMVVSLQTGRVLASRVIDPGLLGVTVDPAGTLVVAVTADGRRLEVEYADLRGGVRGSSSVASDGDDGECEDESERESESESESEGQSESERPSESESESERPSERPNEREAGGDDCGADDGTTDETCDGLAAAVELRAFGLPAPRPGLAGDALRAYLQDAFSVVAALCTRAAAQAWDSGRLGARAADELPHAGELAALLGRTAGLARSALERAVAEEREACQRFVGWGRPGAPHIELVTQFGLSPLAVEILLIAAAPRIWGQLARAYAIVANDPGRPLVDELLVAQLAGMEGRPHEIARELDDDAPLIRHGLIVRGPGARPFAALEVAQAAARRLAGDPIPGAPAGVALEALRAPRQPLAALVTALSLPRPKALRVVVRGRAGAGRRTLAAALAARVGRSLGLVEIAAARLGGEAPDDRLRRELGDATIRGLIPCVSGWDLAGEDAGLRAQLRRVLDAHPGPLFLRGALGTAAPVAPGYLSIELPELDETTRRAAWRHALADRGLEVAPAEQLANRYRLGAGTITRVVASVDPAEPRLAREGAYAVLSAAVRQYRSERIGDIATRVDRLASWSDLVLDDGQLGSLRELVSRIRQRELVLDGWGMQRVASTARGVAAMFQGAPGTGKTLAAGVLARELGYDLYRVDLSRVLSRWLGETEKNLGALFDAAEEGEMVLLFDEADSLFGKRTEVKSSHDRYANVEVNYLLQRLDSFTGIAILTTNFGTAVDRAFERRLSLNLQFSRADEEMRMRLWQLHLPDSVPRRGDLGLAELAARHPMSGGYIRNAALRAAHLAASERATLSHAHLQRSIELEYRDRGQLSTDGILE